MSDIARVPYPISRGWGNGDKSALPKQQIGLGAGMGVLMEFESIFKVARILSINHE